MWAPLFLACSSSSKTTIPAPSPITKPARSLSNGMDARKGSEDVLNAVRLVNPATPKGQIHPSVPPARITSASPYWIARKASPMQWLPDAQAVTTLVHLPFAPMAMEIFPAAMLLIILGTKSGSTLEGPLWESLC